MEFAFTPEQEALRAEIQQFIAENVTPEIVAELESTGVRRRGPKTREMYKEIAERGWIGISWPKEYGGQGLTPAHQRVFDAEAVPYEMPVLLDIPTVGIIAATLVTGLVME